MQNLFHKVAQKTSDIVGSSWAFVSAIIIVLIWAVSGPAFGYSDTWQLVINTGTTILTFLIVFLVQNTQNRDAKAIHLKLDELIRAIHKARNELLDIEDLSDSELKSLHQEFVVISKKAGEKAAKVEKKLQEESEKLLGDTQENKEETFIPGA